MNSDVFCHDIHNQLNEFIFDNSEIIKDNNYSELLNNIKNQSSQTINYINHFQFNNFYLSNSLFNIKNESKTESDKEKETDIKLNINNNINNNNFYHIQNNNNMDNNLKINNNFFPFNESNNKMLYDDCLLNNECNIFNFIENNNINMNMNLINRNNKSNNLFNNNKNDLNINFFNNNDIDSENNTNNNEIKNKNNNDKVDDEDEKNDNYKSDESLINKKIINLIGKRKIKKINKKNAIKVNQVIKYGHPKAIIYKTMKQKLNIHKKLDLECRNDTILLIYTISKLKNILKNILSKENIKDKIRIQNIYKNSILSLQHREYAQDITGYNLL